ncbi:MAG: LamG domain-containing protein, partial [Candidatus Gracilibacteria bacterium]
MNAAYYLPLTLRYKLPLTSNLKDQFNIYSYDSVSDKWNYVNTKIRFTHVGADLYLDAEVNKAGVYALGSVQQPTGIVSTWTMDNSNGNSYNPFISNLLQYSLETVVDSVDGNTGRAYNGSLYYGGVKNQALNFDGVDDYVLVKHNPNLNAGRTPFSVNLWMKASVTNNIYGYANVIYKHSGSGGPSDNWYLRQASTTKRLEASFSDGIAVAGVVSNKEVFDGQWHNIAYVINPAKDLKLYVDGALDVSKPINITGDQDGALQMVMGGTLGGSYAYYKGKLDEVVVVNGEMTAEEIASNYAKLFANIAPKVLTEDFVFDAGSTGEIPNELYLKSVDAGVIGNVVLKIAKGTFIKNSVDGDIYKGTILKPVSQDTFAPSADSKIVYKVGGDSGMTLSEPAIVQFYLPSNMSANDDIKLGYVDANGETIIKDSRMSYDASGKLVIETDISTFGTYFVIYKPQASGLISYYKMDDLDADTLSLNPFIKATVRYVENILLDTQGLNNGKMYGARSTADAKSLRALSFDGVDDYLSVPHNNNLNVGKSPLVVSFWIKSDQTLSANTNGYANIIYKNNGSSGLANNWIIRQAALTKKIQMYFSDGVSGEVGAQAVTFNSVKDVLDNNWHHVVLAIDPANYMKLYVDGVIDNKKDLSLKPMLKDQDGTGVLKIGGNIGAAYAIFRGVMDEVKIYRQKFTDVEVKGLYDAENAGVVGSVDVGGAGNKVAGAGNFADVNYNGSFVKNLFEMPKFEAASAASDSGDYDYGVVAIYNRAGDLGSEIYKLFGYAWTEAGVYMNFDGVEIEIPTACDFEMITANDCAYCADPAHAGDACCATAEEEGLCCNITPNEYTCETCANDPAVSGSKCCQTLIASGQCTDICQKSACLCSSDPLCIDIGGESAGDLGVGNFDIPRVADGADGYYIHLFLKDADGNPTTILNFENLNLGLKWIDTVKADQVERTGDAVTKIGDNSVPLISTLTSADFTASGEAGHYISRNKIISFAPTTDANLSDNIASTDEFESFSNETFIIKEIQICSSPIAPSQCGATLVSKILAGKFTTQPLNNLKLEKAHYSFGVDSDVVSGDISIEKSLPFKPAFELDSLYQDVEKKDNLTAYREVPIDIWLSAKRNATSGSPAAGVSNGEIEAQTTLLHDTSAIEYIVCQNSIIPRTRGTILPSDIFDLYFKKDNDTFYNNNNENFAEASSGAVLDNPNSDDGFADENYLIKKPVLDETGEEMVDSAGDAIMEQIGSKVLKFTLGDLGIESPKSLTGIATFTDNVVNQYIYDANGNLKVNKEILDTACQFIPAPSLYSIIGYQVGGKTVKYYSNQLPRDGKCFLENPAADIRGNVYSQTDLSPTSSVKAYSITKDAVSNLVKNAILNNVKKYAGDLTAVSSQEEPCTITGLSGAVPAGTANCNYKLFKIGAENVLYFDNDDVIINVPLPDTETGQWSGTWTVVAYGGNIYIDNDLYDKNKAVNISRFAKEYLGIENNSTVANGNIVNDLSFVSLAKESENYGEGGNIFISDKIRDVQAVLFADHSVLTNISDLAVDSVSAEFDTKDKFETFYQKLSKTSTNPADSSSNQLFIQGAVSSQNTIGGGPELFRKDGYMLKGTNEVIALSGDEQKDKYVGMYYDWNYFRMFSVCGNFCERMP